MKTMGALVVALGTLISFRLGFTEEIKPMINAPLGAVIFQDQRMGEYTERLPRLGIVCEPLRDEVVKRVVKVDSGNFLNRIRLEEVEKKIIENCASIFTTETLNLKIRYRVEFLAQDSSIGMGGSPYVSSGSTPIPGVAQINWSLGILPSYNRTNYDPKFILKFFEVQ